MKLKLIEKSVIVSELEKRIEETKGMQPQFDQFWAGQISAFKGVLKILDTLEAKEINSTDAFIRKARKYFYKELPNFRSFMESGTAFIKNFESFMKGE